MDTGDDLHSVAMVTSGGVFEAEPGVDIEVIGTSGMFRLWVVWGSLLGDWLLRPTSGERRSCGDITVAMGTSGGDLIGESTIIFELKE